MHIVATNLCVWIRTVVKECTKEIAQYRVNRGHGVSEDYMILGKCMYFVHYVLDKSSNKLVHKAKTLFFHITFVSIRNTQRKYSTLQILKKRYIIRRKCLTSDYVCFRKLLDAVPDLRFVMYLYTTLQLQIRFAYSSSTRLKNVKICCTLIPCHCTLLTHVCICSHLQRAIIRYGVSSAGTAS